MTMVECVTSTTELGGEVVEQQHPAGLLRFENFGTGQWLTKQGLPAKKSRRRYLLDDVEQDSVSSIVGVLDKPALVHWAEDHGARGGAAAQRLGELEGVPEDEILDRIHLLGLGASAKRDEGADRGTAIHAVLESAARYDVIPSAAQFPEQWRPWLTGAANAWRELGITPDRIEQMICRPDLGYAGRFDILGRRSNGKRALVDYKTGKGKIYESAHYQTRLYDMGLEASEIEGVDEILIVGISDDGSHELIECVATAEDVHHLLWVYHSRKRVNAGMAAQRKARKAALKAAA